MKLYGKNFELLRETIDVGQDYDYNPEAKPAIPWSGPVSELRDTLNHATNRDLTQCAMNLYPTGDAYIGPHHNKHHPIVVVTISIGAERPMEVTLEHREHGKVCATDLIWRGILQSGSLLAFGADINEKFKHSIPKVSGVVNPRISATFRYFAK